MEPRIQYMKTEDGVSSARGMNNEAFKSWLDAYKRAWEAGDPKAAADIFTEDATYQEIPFDEPMRGRTAITDYWSGNVTEQDNVQFGYEVLATTVEIGIARWWASFLDHSSKAHVKLDGIFVVHLDFENRCTEFQEWWHATGEQNQ